MSPRSQTWKLLLCNLSVLQHCKETSTIYIFREDFLCGCQ